MVFSADIANLVAAQLSKFVTLSRAQLAGHVANLDFWIGETRHALEVIDGYQERFKHLAPGRSRLHRAPDAELRDARRSVSDATYHFLLRCCNEGLIPEARLRSVCDSLGIGVEPGDIKPRQARGSN